MSKSILIIDTPENCEDCPLFRTDEDFNATIHYCMPYPGKELFMVKEKGVSDNCPLKSMPQKLAENFGNNIPTNTYIMNGTERQYLDMFAVGYNRCINEILGE